VAAVVERRVVGGPQLEAQKRAQLAHVEARPSRRKRRRRKRRQK
jgi:hypothetical protein